MVASLASQLPMAPSAEGGRKCPEIGGSSNPSDPSFVHAVFWDVHGCQVPLREGTGHIPAMKGDFGLQHLLSRQAEGLGNHELTPYAKLLWQRALLGAGSALDEDYECHQTHYTIKGWKKRTMRVLVDYKTFHGYTYKGIITAYWMNGHRGWCRP